MEVLTTLFYLLFCGLGLASLVFFVVVLARMFQNNQAGIGAACILLLFVCGIGQLIAFVYGWMKSREWNLQKIMLAWTACIVLWIPVFAILVVFAIKTASQSATPFHEELDAIPVEAPAIELEPSSP